MQIYMQIYITCFIISAAITFFILYMIGPKPETIIKYPSIENKLSDLYVDDKNVCYRYKTKEIQCPQ